MKLMIAVLTVVIFIGTVFSGDAIKIKFATVAPEGSTWMMVMDEFNKAVQEATNGKVKFQIYAGMVQGDEKDVLRKIRINQLHGGGFTGVGLGIVLPEVRILDAPFLFRSYDEIDFIKNKFFSRFAENFEKKGYILLGWAEVGWVCVYTNTPVRNVGDFKGVKMWMWEGDPLAEATFNALGISPIPLPITDVLTSLQTGMIDGVYSSPLGCIALQWHTKVDYFIDVPLTNSNGAALISKRMFNKLTPEQQKILKEQGRKYFDKLTKLSREDNQKSTEAILKSGVEKIQITNQAVLNNFREIGREARENLVGELYDQELLNQIESALTEFRQKNEEE